MPSVCRRCLNRAGDADAVTAARAFAVTDTATDTAVVVADRRTDANTATYRDRR